MEEIQKASIVEDSGDDLQGIGADEFLPCLIYVFAASHVTWPATLFTYMTKLLPESDFAGPVAYYATAFESVLEYVQFLLDADSAGFTPTPGPDGGVVAGGSWEGERSSASEEEEGEGGRVTGGGGRIMDAAGEGAGTASSHDHDHHDGGSGGGETAEEGGSSEGHLAPSTPSTTASSAKGSQRRHSGGTAATAVVSPSALSPLPSPAVTTGQRPRLHSSPSTSSSSVPAGLHLRPGGSIQSPAGKAPSGASSASDLPMASPAPTPQVPLLYESMAEEPAAPGESPLPEVPETSFAGALNHSFFRSISGATAAKLLTFRYCVSQGLGHSLGHRLPPMVHNTKRSVFRSVSARLSPVASTRETHGSGSEAKDDATEGPLPSRRLQRSQSPAGARWMWIIHPAPMAGGSFAVATFCRCHRGGRSRRRVIYRCGGPMWLGNRLPLPVAKRQPLQQSRRESAKAAAVAVAGDQAPAAMAALLPP